MDLPTASTSRTRSGYGSSTTLPSPTIAGCCPGISSCALWYRSTSVGRLPSSFARRTTARATWRRLSAALPMSLCGRKTVCASAGWRRRREMLDFLNHVIGRTLSSFGQRLEAVGPDLLAMLLILSLGALAAAALRTLLRRLLPRLGVDLFAARVGLGLVLQKGGVTQSPSQAVAAAGAWAVFALAVLLGIGTLNLQFANDLVSRAFNYLPQLLIGVGLILLGSLISAFLRRTVLIAAVNAGLPSARLLAAGVRTAVMILFVAMALEHLSLGRPRI